MSKEVKNIKVFGERNTGTNYLINLLKLNFDIVSLQGTVPKNINRVIEYLPFEEKIKDIYFFLTKNSNFGWKHKELDIDLSSINKKEIIFIIIVKNPYSWLLSLYNRPYHINNPTKGTFDEFITRQWKTVGRESSKKTYENPIKMWNQKNASYLKFKNLENVHIIKYEDLLIDPIKELRTLANLFTLKKQSVFPKNFTKSTKESKKDSSYYKDYYGNEKWINELTVNQIKTINKYLNKEIMALYNYDILNTNHKNNN